MKRLPVNYLKIDGRFVRRIGSDRIAESIVSGIARAARTLGVATIAEHVESAAVADRLRELDVTLGQGFHFGRPQPLADAVQQAVPALPMETTGSSLATVRHRVTVAGSAPPYNPGRFCQVGDGHAECCARELRARRLERLCRGRDRVCHGQPAARACTRQPTRATGRSRTSSAARLLEVLERNPNYARVRLADGREGWVKAMYLVDGEAGRRARARARGRDRRASSVGGGREGRADGGRARAGASDGADAGDDGLRRDDRGDDRRGCKPRTARTRSASRPIGTRCR